MFDCLSVDSNSRRTAGMLPLIAAAAILATASGCGIPNYAAIDPPVRIENIHPNDDSNQPQLPSHVVAFRTPAEKGSTIVGYAIYYKIYRDEKDFDGEEDEVKWFKKDHSIYAVTGMSPGTTLPDKRGFFRLGTGSREKGDTSLSGVGTHYIGHPGPNRPIYIDFDPTGSGGTNNDKRANPLVGFKYPMDNKNPDDYQRVAYRGFIDPTTSEKRLRSFVDDWNFQDRNSTYTDGDLRRKAWAKNQEKRPTDYNVLQYQPGSTVKEIQLVGNPLFTESDYPTALKIGFVAHSYGLDVSGGDLKPLYSTPIYVGTIEYQKPKDTSR